MAELGKSLEAFRNNIDAYKFNYSIRHNHQRSYDICEEFTLKTDYGEKVMKLLLITQVGRIWSIDFLFYLSDETISQVKSLIERLQIPDWHYSIKYTEKQSYDWVKPRRVVRNFTGEPSTKCIHTDDFSHDDHDCMIHDDASYSGGIFIYYRFNSDFDAAMIANTNIIAIINGELSHFDMMPELKYVYVKSDDDCYDCYPRHGDLIDVYQLAINLIK